MGKIDAFFVEFDKQWYVYEPGETVTGRAIFRINDDITCDVVKAQFYGSARVFWVTREMRGSVFGPVTYSQEVVYFNNTTPLWVAPHDDNAGKGVLATPGMLKPGTHTWDFSYELPLDLGTSFDAKHSVGYVRYYVKIALWLGDRIKHSRRAFFTVVAPADLNQNRRLAEPLAVDHQVEVLHAGCCLPIGGSGSVSARLTLEKTGFVPGEPIRLSLEIDNEKHRRQIKVVKGLLVQEVSCMATTPQFRQVDTRAQVTGFCKEVRVRPFAHHLLQNELIMVPAIVPNLNANGVITVKYNLEISLYTTSAAAKRGPLANTGIAPILKFEIPIVIGSIPIARGDWSGDSRLINKHDASADLAPPPYSASSSGNGAAAELNVNPPSYEESVLGFSGVGGQNDDTLCLPRYAVYNFPNTSIN